jgi:hypothetical protein
MIGCVSVCSPDSCPHFIRCNAQRHNFTLTISAQLILSVDGVTKLFNRLPSFPQCAAHMRLHSHWHTYLVATATWDLQDRLEPVLCAESARWGSWGVLGVPPKAEAEPSEETVISRLATSIPSCNMPISRPSNLHQPKRQQPSSLFLST